MVEAPTSCVGRLGVGFSPNGRDFQCDGEPALVPDSPYEARGLAHPRLTLAGGVFLLTYAAFDGKKYRLCLATSTDMKAWFRHGPLFPGFDHKVTSAAILPQISQDGNYHMYVGAGDLYMATSKDLIEWEISSKPILKRSKCPDFASKGVSPGPSPFLTKHGIVALLNATDSKNHTRVFAALFDTENPGKSLAHLKSPCLVAEHDWERFGYLPNVVRASGLSLINNRFHLYYSGADRFIGMATAPIPKELFVEEGEEETEGDNADNPAICGVKSVS